MHIKYSSVLQPECLDPRLLKLKVALVTFLLSCSFKALLHNTLLSSVSANQRWVIQNMLLGWASDEL